MNTENIIATRPHKVIYRMVIAASKPSIRNFPRRTF